jgi:hypothetical protein
MTGSSANDGEFDTSTTTAAPWSTSARPSPVRVFTPVLGAAGTASCPCSPSLATSFDPINPVPPMTTTFTTYPFVRRTRSPCPQSSARSKRGQDGRRICDAESAKSAVMTVVSPISGSLCPPLDTPAPREEGTWNDVAGGRGSGLNGTCADGGLRLEHAHRARGQDRALRQTVAAAGTTLREHHNSREATLQGRGGRHPADAEAITGDLLTVSIAPHTLRAVEDSALLLSVSLGLGAPDSVAPACARRADQPVPQAALRQGYTRAFDGRIRHPSRTTMAMSLSRARRTRSRSWRSRPP